MGFIRNILIASLAVLGSNAASAVIDLIPSNFDDVVLKSGKPSLVEFFAPWCGHCKNLAPVYEELASNFQHAESKVNIAKLDADEHKDLARKYGVQGFPTLKWFDGKSKDPSDYSSGRDLDSLSNFITEKTGLKPRSNKPASQVRMLKDSTFNDTIGGDEHVLVAFTAPWCGHCKSLAPTWETLATDFVSEANVIIAKVDAESPDSKKVADEQGIKSFPTIKYFAAGTKEPAPYEGARTEQAFIDFINEKAGTYRAKGGKLTATAGTIAAIDSVIQKIIDGGKTVGEQADDIVSAAKKETSSKFAEYYSKVAEKVKANAGYVDKELKRLESMLKKGGLAPEKVDDLTTRSNILKKFKGTVMGEDEKSEL